MPAFPGASPAPTRATRRSFRPPTASSSFTGCTTSRSRTAWSAARAASSTSTRSPPSLASCPPAAGWGRPRCCCSGASGCAAGLLDRDGPLHAGMDRALVLERAGLLEALLEGVAAREPAGRARLEVRAGHVVAHAVVVRPLHGPANGNGDRLGVELDVLHGHVDRLPAAATGGSRLLLLAAASPAAASVVVSAAAGSDNTEHETGKQCCQELRHVSEPPLGG